MTTVIRKCVSYVARISELLGCLLNAAETNIVIGRPRNCAEALVCASFAVQAVKRAAAQAALRAAARSRRIGQNRFLIIELIVPVIHPFPHVASCIVQSIG